MKAFAKKYIDIVNYGSTISGAYLQKEEMHNGYTVTAVRSCRDVDENSVKSIQEVSMVNNDLSKWKIISSVALPKYALRTISPSSRLSLGFCNNGLSTAGTKKEQGVFVEVFDDENGYFRLDLSSYHGKVVGDSWFGGCSWSPNERYLVYVAQVNGSSVTSTSRKTVVETLANTDEDSLQEKTASTIFNNKFDYIEDWGEKYVDISELGLFVLDIQERRVVPLVLNDSKEYTIGQPIFLSSSNEERYSIAYTAWNVKPRRLGMIYCYQRKSSIWIADITSAVNNSHDTNQSLPHWNISTNIAITRSPRSSPSGNTLIFLGNRKGFSSHNGCVELFKIDLLQFWKDPNHQADAYTIIREVRNPKENTQAFPGLFLDSLPRQCFLSETEVLLCTTWESRDTLIKVSLVNTNPLEPIFFWANWAEDWRESSCQVLDIQREDRVVLLQVSNPITPSRLVIMEYDHPEKVVFGPPSRAFAITSKYLPSITRQLTPFNHLFWRVFRYDTNNIPFNSIWISPKPKDISLPIVVVPHGGPHSCLTTSFIASYIYLVEMLQVSILFVNYRGSTGFGQESIESLLGNIGTNDVGDIMTAVNHTLSLKWDQDQEDISENMNHPGLLIGDRNRIGIVGGSHGGFLSAHMCGQYPEIFKVACLRNPVTNIPAMSSVTDIPDWCHAEADSGSNDYTRGAIADHELIAMRQASPIAHIERYKAPTLLCLGAKDRRVPVSQGIEFYHMLQTRNIPSRMMIFPEDVHAIDNPTSESEHWIAIAQWLAQFL